MVSTFTELKSALENDGKIEFADNITTTNDEEPNDYVAQIGEDGNVQNFTTLQEAIDAATANQTITLLKDVTIESCFELEDKNLIFDLNGKSITSVGENVDIFRVKGTNIEIYNGTLNAKGVAVFSEGTGGENANKIVVDNVVINSNCWGIYHEVYSFGADVTIINSTITDSHEKGAGIFLSGLFEWDRLNKLSITNSTIKGATAVEVKYGNITIDNSTLEATSETQSVEYSNNGIYTKGYALALTNYEDWTPTFGSINLEGENTLKGGVVVKAESEVFVTTNSPKLISAPEGYYWNGNTLTTIEGLGEAVIGTTYYKTLEEAVAEAQAGQTITLLDDVRIESRFELDKNLIFDLNGKIIESVVDDVDIFKVNGTDITIYNGELNAKRVAVFSEGTDGEKANKIVVENVVIYSNYWSIYHKGNKFGADVTITNSTISDANRSGAGIFLSGSDAWNNANDEAKLNNLSIKNSTIIGFNTAVEVKYGDITIDNSTLEALSAQQKIEHNNNGSCTKGYALALTNNTKDATTPTVGSINLKGENTLEGGVVIKAEGAVDVTTNSPELISAPEGYYWNEGALTKIEDQDAEAIIIGGAYYTTLEDAVVAAEANQTITLLKDVKIESRFELDKHLIFDLNGKKIESVVNDVDIFKVNGTDITIYNGTLNAKRVAVFSSGNTEAAETANKIVVENVEIKSNYWGIYHNGNAFGADVTIINSTITDTDAKGAGIFLSGSEKWNNAKEGEKLNKLSIVNSTIKGATAVEVKYGNITIDNSMLEATSEKQSVEHNNNGNCTKGYALALTNNTKDATTSTVGSINLEGENSFKGGFVIKADGEVDVTTNSPELILAPEGYYWNEGTLTKMDNPNAVAMIGAMCYETLESAMEDAKANDQIVILKDVTIKNPLNITCNLTFIGNNKTLTYTGSDRAITVEKETDGANLTINNLKIEFTKNYCQRGINYNTTGKLTLNNVTINEDAKDVTYAINLPSDSYKAVVNIKDSNINGNIALNIWGEETNINAVNTDFTSIDNNTAENYAAIVFNNNGVISAAGSSITTTGGRIKAYDEKDALSIAVMLAAAANHDGLDQLTTTLEGYIVFPEAVVYYDGTDNFYTCMTFKEAIDKAIETKAAGVRLINWAQGPGIIIEEDLGFDLTIDLCGNTYEFTTPAAVPEVGLYIKKGNNITLRNGTLMVAESARSEYFKLIWNFANLTVEDMELDATNADAYVVEYNDSYALSNYSGTVNIKGNTTIKANDEGNLNYAIESHNHNALDYKAPVVTVNTTGKIEGIVEVSAVLNLEVVGKNSIFNLIIKGEGQVNSKVSGVNTTIVKTFENDNNDNAEDDWYTLATPFEHSVESLQTESAYALYRYNEEQALWENVKVSENNFTTLELGRGYIYANATTTDVEFNGTLNIEDVEYELTASSETNLKGFHLVGNPFAHEISMDNLTTEATLADGFYVLSNDGAWVPKTGNDNIAVCQGVLIKTTEAATLTINNEALRSTRAVNNGQLMINVANSKYNDVAYVSFNEGVGLDKIAHRNAEVPMVYVPVNGTDYAVAMMNKEVTEIPVSFVANSLGQYTFSVEAQDCEFSTMYLYDRLTGETTNLLLEDYTFMAKSGDNAERFIIKLASGNDNAANINNFAFISNGELIINNIDGEGIVRIVDVLGRPVAEYNVFGSANISTTTIRSGVYMIQMIDGNGTKVQKIIID